MDLLAALLQSASFLGLALALCVPRLLRGAAVLALVTAGVCVLLGAFGPSPRTLVATHAFLAYEGITYEPTAVHHPTDTVQAPGWLWPLPFLGFALLWTALLRWRPASPGPFWWPMLLAWTATAAWLGMQKLAAPAEVVQPYGLDRFLWPAGLALALGLARNSPRFLPVFLQLALGVTGLRLPAALFSKVASDRHLGTGLDVSKIVDIVHPFSHQQFEPPLAPGSSEQQFWLIWAEHVLVFPSLHVLSLTGIAFAVWLARRRPDALPART